MSITVTITGSVINVQIMRDVWCHLHTLVQFIVHSPSWPTMTVFISKIHGIRTISRNYTLILKNVSSESLFFYDRQHVLYQMGLYQHS